jgi:hypothetical protein
MTVHQTQYGPRALVSAYERQTLLNAKSGVYITHCGYPNDGTHEYMVGNLSVLEVSTILQAVSDGERRLNV